MECRFLDRFYPLIRAADLRNSPQGFVQHYGEALYATWDRFKEFMQGLPEDHIPPGMAIQYSYRGLDTESRVVLVVAAGGSLWSKSFEEAYDLIENLATAEYQNKQSSQATYFLSDAISAATCQPVSSKYEWVQLGQFMHRDPDEPVDTELFICELAAALFKTLGILNEDVEEHIRVTKLEDSEWETPDSEG